MIYYLDKEVDWNKKSLPPGSIEKQVKEEIEKIRSLYFGDKSTGVVKLIYPKGKPKEGEPPWLAALKRFMIDLKSPDGVWRYSKGRRHRNGTWPDHHLEVTYNTMYKEEDIELLWFLLQHSSAMKGKYVYIEDLEAEAKEEIKEMATDAYIAYMLTDKRSPIFSNETLIKQVAEIFGVRDVDKKGINQLRLELYDCVLEGEQMGDRFANYDKFEEMTSGSIRRKAAFNARRSINDGIVGYKDRAWWLKEGREFTEKLLPLSSDEVQDRDEAFVDAVVNDRNIRARLYLVIGEEELQTADDLRDLDRPALFKMCKDRKGNDNKEALVKKLCEQMGIDYDKA